MEEYRYSGIELTPSVFTELLVELFDGKQFKRQDAIDAIKSYHEKNGGILGKTNYVNVFKKTASSLKDNGLANVGYGVWRLTYNTKNVDYTITPREEKETTYIADKIIGIGKSSVYVYYYDIYKMFAESINNNSWECKIGRTDRDPLSRVFDQAGTCYPELPHIALIINCDDSSLLESTIHNVLKIRGKWISKAPGKEWYITSPEEVEEIYSNICDNH